MNGYSNPLGAKILALLSPLVGDSVALGVLKAQTKKIGTDPESLKIENLAALAEGIKTGLNLFLGSSAALQVAEKIRDIR